MNYGVVLPGGTATEQLELAVRADQAGWDGVFVWEAAYGVDAWSLLAAMAVRTSRVRLGTMLTPLPWRRPWKVASQVATVDQLSGGRAILAVGLGATEPDIPRTDEALDLRTRADRLDEGIDLIRALWAGETGYNGHHYRFEGENSRDLIEVARPVQPRIPIWVVGLWPRPKSMQRVLRCDGIVPQFDLADRDPAPDDAGAIGAWLAARDGSAIDILAEGETSTLDPSEAGRTVAPWADAGCTWWLETRWELPHHSPERLAEVRDRIAAGPPGGR